jgi:hypothetical protein
MAPNTQQLNNSTFFDMLGLILNLSFLKEEANNTKKSPFSANRKLTFHSFDKLFL